MPILRTKLFAAQPARESVQRPRLLACLDDGLNSRLVLVSAQAGSGKTTLLADWTRQLPMPAAWLSLDESDNDLTGFLSYFIAALQSIFPGIGEAEKLVLQSPQAPPVEPLLAALLNEINAGTTPFALILDDYHAIRARSIHQAVTFLIDHMPMQMHLVLATRADPPLPLARLRSRDQLTELRAADLCFLPQEAAVFLDQALGTHLSPGQAAALTARTEGWIAGLQLAALSLKGRTDVDGFIAAFTGSHRYILDYLMEEVLRGQPEDVQAFLLGTSILNSLSGSLCDALMQDDPARRAGEDSQAMLEYLDQHNLFIVPLDDTRDWYRYHHLFAELLRSQLVRQDAGQVTELHRRASRWYTRQGMVLEAIQHALPAGEWEKAANLVEQNSLERLYQGELMTVSAWLSLLPEDLLQARPWLSVYQAWVQVLTSQLDGIEACLTQAGRNLPSNPSEQRRILGHMAAIRAYAASKRSDTDLALGLSREALQFLPGAGLSAGAGLSTDSLPAGDQSITDLPVRSLVSFTLGMVSLSRGDIQAACPALEEAGRLSRVSAALHMAIPAYCALGVQQVILGQLHQAGATFEMALQLAATPDGKILPLATRAYCELSELQYEWNQLEAAAGYARESVDLWKKWGNPEAGVRAYRMLAQTLHAQGYLEDAYAALHQADQIIHQHNLAFWSTLELNACRVRLWLDPAAGDRAALIHWVEAHQSALQDAAELPYLEEPEHIALAQALIALDQPARALRLLERLYEQAQAGKRLSRVIQTLALKASALSATGEYGNALSTLEQALALAEPEGFVRTFLDVGAPVAGLLEKMVSGRQPAGAAYIRRLLSCFGVTTVEPDKMAERLIEPLSARELEVLGLLAAGLSNGEIAHKLVIAISTVKRHINHIFGKLGVASRTQAIVKARQLRLL